MVHRLGSATRPRAIRRFVTVGVATALVLAACGSDKSLRRNRRRRKRQVARHRPTDGCQLARSVARVLRHVSDLHDRGVRDTDRSRHRQQDARPAPGHLVGSQRRTDRVHLPPRSQGQVRRRLASHQRRCEVLVGASQGIARRLLLSRRDRADHRHARPRDGEGHDEPAQLCLPGAGQRQLPRHRQQQGRPGARRHRRPGDRQGRDLVPVPFGGQRPLRTRRLHAGQRTPIQAQRQLLGRQVAVPGGHHQGDRRGRHTATATRARRRRHRHADLERRGTGHGWI